MNGMQLEETFDADSVLRDPIDELEVEDQTNEEEEVPELDLGGDSRRSFEYLGGEDDYNG